MFSTLNVEIVEKSLKPHKFISTKGLHVSVGVHHLQDNTMGDSWGHQQLRISQCAFLFNIFNTKQAF